MTRTVVCRGDAGLKSRVAEWEDAVRKWGDGCLERHDLGERGRGGGGRGGKWFFGLLLASGERLVVRTVERSGAALGIFGVKRHENYRVRD